MDHESAPPLDGRPNHQRTESQSRFSIDSSDMVVTVGVSLDATRKNAGGAPIEDESPMGKEVGWWSIVLLNISGMIGTGIFSTPGGISKETGSVGLALLYWVIGFFISMFGLAYYIELGAAFPNRAGADVAYFEQIYKRPKFLFPATFAMLNVLLGFASSNCIVFAQYVMYAHSTETPDPWIRNGIAVGAYALICLFVVLHTKGSIWLSNALALVKIGTLLFVVVTGWVILAGGTRIKDSHSHFAKPFSGSKPNGNDLASALVNIHYTYSGWNTANTVMNEIGGNKIRKLKSAGSLSIFIIFFLFFFANVAYYAAMPFQEAKESGQLIAAVFFTKVFGEYAGHKVLPIFIALSAFGNLLTLTISQARIMREIARQGVIPFSAFFSSTKPFGTPATAVFLKFIITVIGIVAPPPGDAFNLLISLQVYPARLFDILLVIGVWILRRRRQRAGLGRLEFQAWNVALVFSIIICAFILIMPWMPPKTGTPSAGYWYGTANAVGLGALVLCFVYWLFWARLLPKVFDYSICEEITRGEKGELSKRFVRVYNDERGDPWRNRRQEDESDATAAEEYTSGDESKDKIEKV